MVSLNEGGVMGPCHNINCLARAGIFNRKGALPVLKGMKREEIFAQFPKTFATKTRDEWVHLSREGDIPSGPVNSFEEVFDDPQVRYQNVVGHMAHPILGMIK
jgi:crotonobetainyl-CoA:carnitine CoA-transferase CaiB-like acyl-CoA transferase